MQIPFHMPYAFQSGSDPVDSRSARKVIHECARRLQLRHGKRARIDCYYRKGNTVVFDLNSVFVSGSKPIDNARALRVLLDCMVSLNLAYLRNHATANLYRSGVVYGRTKMWEPIPSLYARGYGDCKSVATALIAEYQLKGVDASPVFRWVMRADGTQTVDFHILVQVPSGTKIGFEDPSKVLGMGSNENAHY